VVVSEDGRRVTWPFATWRVVFATAAQPLSHTSARWTVRVRRPTNSQLLLGVRLCPHPVRLPWIDVSRHVLTFNSRCGPVGTDPAVLTPLHTQPDFKFTATECVVSFEADLRVGWLYVWLNGQLLGGMFDGFTAIGGALPTVGIGHVCLSRERQWDPADAPTVELLDSPLDTN
jgi:hypothetical protein